MIPRTPDDLIALLRWRMDHDYDNVIVIDGYEGSGKSTLGIQLAYEVDDTFSMESVLFDHQDFNEAYDTRKKRAYVLDEGGNLGFSRDYNKRENKGLMRLLMASRQVNATMIFCVPNFHWLDSYIREHRAQFRIHVEKRGVAVVQNRLRNWRSGSSTWQDLFKIRFGPLPKDVLVKYRAQKAAKFDRQTAQQVGAKQDDPLNLKVEV